MFVDSEYKYAIFVFKIFLSFPKNFWELAIFLSFSEVILKTILNLGSFENRAPGLEL